MTSLSTPPLAAELLPFIQAYLAARPFFYAFIRPQEAYLFNYHRVYLKPPILDFGCGDGFFASLIFPPRTVAVGLDVAAGRLQDNPPTSSYQKLVAYDGLKIPFKPASFTSIISNCVFEHLPQLKLNLQEIYRILKPGGYLLTTVMGDAWDAQLLGGKIFGSAYLSSLRQRQVHHNLLSFKTWQKHFRQTGFDIIDAYGYSHLKATRCNELCHYLAFPSLVSYRLTGRWVLAPAWYRWLALDRLILPLVQSDFSHPPDHSAAFFFILQKPG